MLKNWLEPAVKQRVQKLTDDFCDDGDVKLTYESFIVTMEKLKQSPIETDKQKALLKLEDLFNTSFRLGVEISYRVGFEDGLDLGKSI